MTTQIPRIPVTIIDEHGRVHAQPGAVERERLLAAVDANTLVMLDRSTFLTPPMEPARPDIEALIRQNPALAKLHLNANRLARLHGEAIEAERVAADKSHRAAEAFTAARKRLEAGLQPEHEVRIAKKPVRTRGLKRSL